MRASKQRSRQRLPRHSPASPFLRLGLSWLSSSRPSGLPTVPEPGPGPAPAVTSLEAPHAGTRSANPPELAGPKPVGGFAAPRGHSPTLKHDGLDAYLRTYRGLSASPPFREHNTKHKTPRRYRIERRDYSALQPWDTKPELQPQDYSDEPPSSTASHSRGTALYWHSTRWLVRPSP